jgi:LysR family glycine cleavage system transcriptional activator
MSLPPLASFRFFNAAAQTQSFIKAAEQLHVTHGAVSRQIRSLEEALGVELFERRNRAVFLNHAGRLLHEATQPMFEQLEQAVRQVQRKAGDDILVLSCEPTIAMKWLIPRLPAFHRAHPDIQIQLLAAGGPIDFARCRADLAIRRDDFHWDDSVHSSALCTEWVGPVCAPSLAGPASLLSGVHLLRSRTRPAAWEQWLRLVQKVACEVTTVDYEHFYLCVQAASAGLGVTMASMMMVQDELASGQLVAPFGFVRDGSGYFLLSAQPTEESPKCSAFHHWLESQAQASVAHAPHGVLAPTL